MPPRRQVLPSEELFRMPIRNLIVAGFAAAAVVWTAAPELLANAQGTDAQTFVEQEHKQLDQLLHQPDSASRENQIHNAMGGFVDYDELTRRAFGTPCPTAEPACKDLWDGYDDGQKTELRSLLEQLVRKTYQRNLAKTLDFDITYHGEKSAGGDTKVMTEAKDRSKPREPAVRVDYVVKDTPKGPRVVDIVTEGSSLTKNYYDQFDRKLKDPAQGYANIVQKLRDKIAAP
jgi:phospholipid transport system substrate-binding protein